MEEKTKGNGLIRWITIFTLFPVIATFIILCLSFQKIGNIPSSDLFLIFIYPLFFIVVLPKLFLAIKSKPTHSDIMVFTAFIILFAMGLGMHSTMNTVDVFSSKRGIIRVADEDVREMIWFFDELLGHLLIYLGYYGLMLQFCFLEKEVPIITLKWRTLIMALFGFMWGIGMSVGIVEAGFTLFVLSINVLSLLLIYHLMQKNREKSSVFLQKHPFILFYLIQTLTIMPLIIIYFIFFGLEQPSEIFKSLLIEIYGN